MEKANHIVQKTLLGNIQEYGLCVSEAPKEYKIFEVKRIYDEQKNTTRFVFLFYIEKILNKIKMENQEPMYLEYEKTVKVLGVTILKEVMYMGRPTPNRSYLKQYFLFGIFKIKTIQKIKDE